MASSVALLSWDQTAGAGPAGGSARQALLHVHAKVPPSSRPLRPARPAQAACCPSVMPRGAQRMAARRVVAVQATQGPAPKSAVSPVLVLQARSQHLTAAWASTTSYVSADLLSARRTLRKAMAMKRYSFGRNRGHKCHAECSRTRFLCSKRRSTQVCVHRHNTLSALQRKRRVSRTRSPTPRPLVPTHPACSAVAWHVSVMPQHDSGRRASCVFELRRGYLYCRL